MSTEEKIEQFLKELNEVLISKNIKYNDSLQRTTGYFSKLPVEEKIKSRIDDKLNRIIKSEEINNNDLIDLIGYCVHLSIHKEIKPKDYIN